jgi:hypothetical protein
MALTITDTIIRGDRTPHTAAPTGDGWSVTWLPGRPLTRNQAITAMILANTAATPTPHLYDRVRPHLGNWAAELGLTTPDALARLRSTEAGR